MGGLQCFRPSEAVESRVQQAGKKGKLQGRHVHSSVHRVEAGDKWQAAWEETSPTGDAAAGTPGFLVRPPTPGAGHGVCSTLGHLPCIHLLLPLPPARTPRPWATPAHREDRLADTSIQPAACCHSPWWCPSWGWTKGSCVWLQNLPCLKDEGSDGHRHQLGPICTRDSHTVCRGADTWVLPGRQQESPGLGG